MFEIFSSYPAKKAARHGFTLIELSIVLIIIGLIVGSVLTGRNLISAAAGRSQISQIEKFNTAVNTFRDKYGGLPGDLNSTAATTFGFTARGQYAGEGDGNGVIEGNWNNTTGNNSGQTFLAGETATFWVDLSQAKLIEGNFSMASETSSSVWYADLALSSWQCGGCNEIANMLPQAKIGQNDYVYVRSLSSTNYFSVSAVIDIAYSGGSITSGPGFTVAQAAGIDAKMDDGAPTMGRVTSEFIAQNGLQWETFAAGYPYWDSNGTAGAVALPQTGTSCFDNGNNASAPYVYSVGAAANGGAGVNCGLSFKFQ